MPQSPSGALRVGDLDTARAFYRDVLGCEELRRADTSVDVDFCGHRLVLQLDGRQGQDSAAGGTDDLPPCFDPVVVRERFLGLAERLRSRYVSFVIPPTVRRAGLPGEEWTMHFRDPSGNAIRVTAVSP